MIYTSLFWQLSRCLAGWNHALGQYVAVLSRAIHTANIPFDGHLEFVPICVHRRGVMAPTRGHGNCDVRQGMRVLFRCGRNRTSSFPSPGVPLFAESRWLSCFLRAARAGYPSGNDETRALRHSEERFRLMMLCCVKDYSILMLDPRERIIRSESGSLTN